MKAKFLIIPIIVLMLFFASMAIGAETYYNQTVEVDDSPGYVTYSISFTVSDTITATVYYSEAMKIGALSEGYGYSNFQVAGTATGTEDINVFIEYADDPEETNTRWALHIGTTDADLDAVGTTTVEDTIGIVANSAEFKYKKYSWMRYKFILGQANHSGKIMKAATKFIKPEGLKDETVGQKASTPDS